MPNFVTGNGLPLAMNTVGPNWVCLYFEFECNAQLRHRQRFPSCHESRLAELSLLIFLGLNVMPNFVTGNGLPLAMNNVVPNWVCLYFEFECNSQLRHRQRSPSCHESRCAELSLLIFLSLNVMPNFVTGSGLPLAMNPVGPNWVCLYFEFECNAQLRHRQRSPSCHESRCAELSLLIFWVWM